MFGYFRCRFGDLVNRRSAGLPVHSDSVIRGVKHIARNDIMGLP